jgi:hypothetical protein
MFFCLMVVANPPGIDREETGQGASCHIALDVLE